MSAISTANLSSSSSTPQNAGDAVNSVGGHGEGETHGGTPDAGGQCGQSKKQEGSNDVEVVERCTGAPVVSPALVYTKQGNVVEVGENIVAAVDTFHTPDGFVRKGSREQSYMYSLGVYVEQSGGINHKFFCMADAECRRANRVIPCKKGDRSNVNTHLKTKHGMQGNAGVKKDAKKKDTQASIKACLGASRNSSVGTNRWVLPAVNLVPLLLCLRYFHVGKTTTTRYSSNTVHVYSLHMYPPQKTTQQGTQPLWLLTFFSSPA